MLSLVLLCYIFSVTFFIYFAKKETRFKIASDLQGTQISSYIFSILEKKFPKDSNIVLEKSVPYNKRGLYSEGFKLLDQAVRLNQKEHLGYRGWIKLNKLKDYKGAISDLEKLNKISPKYSYIMPGEDINYLLAISYQGSGNYEMSKKYYQIFFKETDSLLLHSIPHTYVNYGILLEKLGNYPEAMFQYNKSLKIGTYNFAESYYNKGILFEKMKLKDSAKICFEKALQQYDKGYRVKDIYNEVFNEIYREDITNKIEHK